MHEMEYSVTGKKDVLPFTIWVDLEQNMLRKIS